MTGMMTAKPVEVRAQRCQCVQQHHQQFGALLTDLDKHMPLREADAIAQKSHADTLIIRQAQHSTCIRGLPKVYTNVTKSRRHKPVVHTAFKNALTPGFDGACVSTWTYSAESRSMARVWTQRQAAESMWGPPVQLSHTVVC